MKSENFDRLSTEFAETTSRRKALKLMGAGLLGGLVAANGADIATAQRGRSTAGSTVTLPQVELPNGTLGTVSPTSFATDGQVLTVVGNILDAAGNLLGTFTGLANVVSPATCEILSLELGPLTLDLLGLVVEIPNPVILTITAVPGPGNLLGNLLCAVAGLLDRGGPLQGLVGLLNNILRQLGLA